MIKDFSQLVLQIVHYFLFEKLVWFQSNGFRSDCNKMIISSTQNTNARISFKYQKLILQEALTQLYGATGYASLK